jgi:hypothetical protein
MAAAFGVRRLVAAFRLKKANEKRRELILLANFFSAGGAMDISRWWSEA